MPGDGVSWPEAMVASSGAIMVFVVASIAIWQAFKTWQAKVTARVAIAHDEAYRALAEQAAATQQTLADEQRRLADEVAGLGVRLSAVEKLLREVG